MPSVSSDPPSLCDWNDHASWSKTRRFTYIIVELALILCGVILSQSVRSYGHGFSYMIVFALCSIVLQLMPYGLGSFTRGNGLSAPRASASEPSWLGDTTTLLKSNPFDSMLMTLTIQWLACLIAASVVQACGTFRWFHNLLVKYLNSKGKRVMLPTISALLGVFTAMACGTDAINLMYVAPLISASKVIGLRPSKSLSALVTGGMLGAACSPVSSAAQFYYNRYATSDDKFADPTNTDIYELMPFGRISACVIPAAVVGAIVAGIVATFIGRDLATSKTYQQRYEAGLVALPGEEDFAGPAGYYYYSSRSGDPTAAADAARAAQQNETVESANVKLLTKLEKEFSMQSRLEDGDFVYTNARFRDGTYVDVNDRTGGSPARQTSTGTRKSVTINVKKSGEVTPEAAPPAHPTHRHYQSDGPIFSMAWRNALIALGVMVAMGIATLVWGILRGIPREDQFIYHANISRDNIITDSWPLPAELIFPILVTAASGVLMLSLRLKPAYLNHAPIVRQALPAIIGQVCFCSLGSSYLWEWKNNFNCIAISSDASRDNNWTWPFWVCIMSILSGSDMITQSRLSHYISFLPKVTERLRWLTTGFPTAAGAIILPTNANILFAAHLDDTGSTRLGQFLFDHVFIVPGIVGIVIAAIIAWAISVGVFPM